MRSMEQQSGGLGLETAQVLPVVEAVAGEPIADFAVGTRGLKEGHSGGDKQFWTFRYTTREGRAGEATLFVKRCAWKGRSEAIDYRYLAPRGVPTPRLYGVVSHP